jgi:hypothetical protein
MAGRRELESNKAEHAVRRALEAVRQGRQVVLYAEAIEGGKFGGWQGLEAIATILERELGVGKVGRLYGGLATIGARRAQQQTLAAYMAGDIPVIVGTPKQAGTGLSLDDVRGDRPRTLILITPPFSALEWVQIAGRVNRLTTMSRAEVIVLITPTSVDRWNLGISIKKLRLLGAAAKGETAKLEPTETRLHESTQKYKRTKSATQLEFDWQASLAGIGADGPGPGDGGSGGGLPAGGTPADQSAAGARVRVLASLIRQEALTSGVVNVVGKPCGTMAEAVVLARLFRDPRWEIFRWVFTREGKVVGTYALTARRPNMVHPLQEGETTATIRERMRRLGADGFWMVHNHPSGEATPSPEDQRVTRMVAASISGFQGHIVIDHGEWADIDKDGHASMHTDWRLLRRTDPLRQPAQAGFEALQAKPKDFTTHPQIRGRFVDSVDKAATVLSEMALGDEGITVLLVNTKMRAVALLHVQTRGPYEELVTQLQRAALESGARFGFGYSSQPDPMLPMLVSRGVLEDGFTPGWASMRELAAEEQSFEGLVNSFMGGSRPQRRGEGWFGKAEVSRKEVMELAEETRRYGGTPTVTAGSGLYFDGAPIKPGKPPAKMAVALGGLDKVRPVEMPELVKLARELMGRLPELKRFPKARGMFYGKGRGMIKLDPSIFIDSTEAAKTLAHEIGHLIDYLPDEWLRRGNLLGRLATLRDFLLHTLPLSSADPLTKCLTPEDRARLRREAERRVGPRPPKDELADLAAWQSAVSREYAELVEDEIQKRGLLKVEEVTEELRALGMFWKPYDPSAVPASYHKYRQSAVELYADALSVLLNSPGLLEEMAPLFYKTFWEYLDRKPEVKSALFRLQDWLSEGKLSVLEERERDLEESFRRGSEIMRQKALEREARRTSWKGWWMELAQAVLDKYEPVTARARAAEGRGAKWARGGDPRRVLDELGLKDVVIYRWIRAVFEGVVQPVEARGMTVEDLGKVLFLERIAAGDRSVLANPAGHTPQSARMGLLKMRLDLGMERMTTLKAAVQKFHDLVFAVTQQAVEVGAYNRKTFEETIEPNKDYYAAFAVLKYLEDFIPAGIRKQVGTFEDVANPFLSTVYKVTALHNLIAYQRAKNVAIDGLLRVHFSDEIKPAEMVGPHGAQRPREKAGWGLLQRLENGRPAWYYVDPLVAQAFERLPPAQLWPIVRLLDTSFRRIFYPLFITYNPAFMLLLSPTRDFGRTRLGLPVHFGRWKLAREYMRVWSDAVSRFKGEASDLTREMEANFAIGTPFDTFARGNREDQFGDLLRRYQLLPQDERKGFFASQFMRPARAALEWIEFYGMVLDSLPKYAGYRILTRDMGWAPRSAAAWVRNYAGLPNVYRKGLHVNLVRGFIPFLNVWAQGTRADLELMTGAKTRSGWWFRWAATDGLWAALTGAAAAGLLGAALKELFDGISEYNKLNYNVLPIGWTAGGEFGKRVVYIRVPRSETSRLVSGALYALVSRATGAEHGLPTELLDFGLGQFPTFNPTLSLAEKWIEYASGVRPVNPFSGKPIVPETEWRAGGLDSLTPMATWTLQQSGIGNFVRWNPQAQSTTELTVSAIPGLNRLVGVTDAGYRERQQRDQGLEDQARAQAKLRLPDEVRAALREHSTLRGLGDARTDQQGERWAVLNTWYNNVYRQQAEVIQVLEEGGDQAGAKAARESLGEMTRAFVPARR